MIDEQSASGHDYASDRSAIGAGQYLYKKCCVYSNETRHMHGKPIYVSREYNEPYSITNRDQAIIASECVPLSATTPYTPEMMQF